MQVKFTEAFRQRICHKQPPAADTSYFSIDIPGLAIRVKPARRPGREWSASAFVRWTEPLTGTERRHTIADARKLTVAEIESLGREALVKIARGWSPAAERTEARAQWTVARLCAEYHASDEFKAKAVATQAREIAICAQHLQRSLGNVRLQALDVPAIRRMLRTVTHDTRTNARGRRMGGAGTARKAARVLSSMLTWAVGQGAITRNPIIGNLRLDGDGSRETVITEPAEYARLFAAMDRLVAEGQLRSLARAFITLAAATGARRGELQALRRSNVDLRRRQITLTTSKGSKLARRGVRTETMSLPPIAAAALAAIWPDFDSPDDRIFPTTRGQRISIHRDWCLVRDAAGLPADMVLHSLRHSAGTVGILAGMSTVEVQKLLRHRNVATTSKYVHLAEANRARLQDRMLEHVLPDAEGAAVWKLR
jgi:integrase